MQALTHNYKKYLAVVTTNSRSERRKKWQVLVEEFHRSKQNRKRYCEEKQINYHTFKYWIEKFKDQAVKGFIPVQCTECTPPAAPIKPEPMIGKRLCILEFDGNKRLVIESVEALKELKAILKALK